MRVLTTACTPCPASFAPRSCTVMWMQSRSPTFQRVPPCSFAVSSPASHPQVMHCYVNAKEVTNIPPFCLGLICCVLPCPRPPGHALLCGCKGGHQHITISFAVSSPASPSQVMHCYADAKEVTNMPPFCLGLLCCIPSPRSCTATWMQWSSLTCSLMMPSAPSCRVSGAVKGVGGGTRGLKAGQGRTSGASEENGGRGRMFVL